MGLNITFLLLRRRMIVGYTTIRGLCFCWRGSILAISANLASTNGSRILNFRRLRWLPCLSMSRIWRRIRRNLSLLLSISKGHKWSRGIGLSSIPPRFCARGGMIWSKRSRFRPSGGRRRPRGLRLKFRKGSVPWSSRRSLWWWSAGTWNSPKNSKGRGRPKRQRPVWVPSTRRYKNSKYRPKCRSNVNEG